MGVWSEKEIRNKRKRKQLQHEKEWHFQGVFQKTQGAASLVSRARTQARADTPDQAEGQSPPSLGPRHSPRSPSPTGRRASRSPRCPTAPRAPSPRRLPAAAARRLRAPSRLSPLRGRAAPDRAGGEAGAGGYSASIVPQPLSGAQEGLAGWPPLPADRRPETGAPIACRPRRLCDGPQPVRAGAPPPPPPAPPPAPGAANGARPPLRLPPLRGPLEFWARGEPANPRTTPLPRQPPAAAAARKEAPGASRSPIAPPALCRVHLRKPQKH
ncbi:basic proline-rich protein-like [Mustela erminea]|uniref:basic proline-rich protein-like n=1 Tax=Mustela erminea TaxID=36723 RepID=UPI001387671F|nr:basic proline-rich protein-like [Mustela erminea]